MNKYLETIRKYLSDYEKTEDSLVMDLRLDFLDILLKELKSQNISLDELSEKTGIRKKILEKILHSNYNLKISEMAKIGYVLGLKLSIEKE